MLIVLFVFLCVGRGAGACHLPLSATKRARGGGACTSARILGLCVLCCEIDCYLSLWGPGNAALCHACLTWHS